MTSIRPTAAVMPVARAEMTTESSFTRPQAGILIVVLFAAAFNAAAESADNAAPTRRPGLTLAAVIDRAVSYTHLTLPTRS